MTASSAPFACCSSPCHVARRAGPHGCGRTGQRDSARQARLPGFATAVVSSAGSERTYISSDVANDWRTDTDNQASQV